MAKKDPNVKSEKKGIISRFLSYLESLVGN